MCRTSDPVIIQLGMAHTRSRYSPGELLVIHASIGQLNPTTALDISKASVFIIVSQLEARLIVENNSTLVHEMSGQMRPVPLQKRLAV
ncbi:hypothetical protein TNCV_4734611 [Trichonephila clavipes]|nr:hypothetical protein TNCV_4734611 [Trichonephila clavipes]